MIMFLFNFKNIVNPPFENFIYDCKLFKFYTLTIKKIQKLTKNKKKPQKYFVKVNRKKLPDRKKLKLKNMKI